MARIKLGFVMSSIEELKNKALQRRKKKMQVDDKLSTASDVARAGFQGLTFGFGDELVALAKSLGDKTYEEAIAEEREALERFREESPQYAYPIEIAASIPTSLLGVGLLGRGAQAAGRFIPSALKSAPVGAAATGAVEGALYGAGAAEEGERLAGAGIGGAAGGRGGDRRRPDAALLPGDRCALWKTSVVFERTM